MSVLRVSQLDCGYGSQPVLHGVSLSVPEKAVVALLGPNGSGKTTLLKTLLGLLSALSGKVEWDGTDFKSFSMTERAQRISWVPQKEKPSFDYTVAEIVEMGRNPWSPAHRQSAEDVLQVGRALNQVGLTSYGARPFSKLSGGEQQKVLLARAIAQDTSMIFLDEPTTHLDYENQEWLICWLKGERDRRSKSILLTTHDVNLAVELADRVYWLANGECKDLGSPNDKTFQENLEGQLGRWMEPLASTNGVRWVRR